MDLSPILNSLNDAQREAVTAPIGPVLVLAGAGSGKTRVLTHRIAWLIQTEGVSPHGILAVTFTNKAAAEMRGRVEQLLGMPGGALWLGTFHGLAHRLLRLHWREAGLPQGFQILDSDDQQRLIKKLLKSQNLDESRWSPRDVQYFINKHKDEGRRPQHLKAGADATETQLLQLYKQYEENCARNGVIDFAELLLRAFELWRDNPQVLQHYRTRFRHVLVDEFQDTNSIQYAWIRLLIGSEGAPFAVGDDDQCLPAGTPITMADGAKRAIETLSPGDEVLSNYGCGDFRAARVQNCFGRRRRTQLVNLHLRSGAVIKSTPEHVHFAGYVAGETPQTHFLYLMYKEGIGYRLGTSQVYTESHAAPIADFTQCLTQEGANAAWIIRVHSNQQAARQDEIATSRLYRLAAMPFNGKDSFSNRLARDATELKRVFGAVETLESAERLLDDVGLDVDRPHHRAVNRASNRHDIVITLCADRAGVLPMHRICVVGVNAKDRAVLEGMGLRVVPAKSGSRRFETARSDFGEIMAIARGIRARLDGHYVLQAHMLDKCLPFTTAASIRPGMVMANDAGQFDVVERIEHDSHDAKVYDIDVERTHNFIAGGIVTHNSIYRWRGAKVENLHKFRDDFPQAKLIRLEQNYRSTASILDAANALISNNSGRLGKTLWTSGARGEPVKLFAAFNERDEADFVVTRILEWTQRGGLRREAAILYRSNAQSRSFEEALIMARVPYRVYGGLRFFERAEIKDALAYLRLLTNRDDDASFERVVNLPTRGIGAKSVDTLREAARGAGSSMWRAAAAAVSAGEAGRSAGALLGFMQLIERMAHAIDSQALHEQVDHVINQSGLIEHYQKDKADRGEARVDNLLELVSAARGYEPENELPPLQSFLAHAVLESGEGQGDAWEDCVQMMTLHSAKGLEFPLVFLCGMEDGLFPHQRSVTDLESLEEERRLCYVGTTRAMRQLYLTYAEQRRLHGVDSYNAPSRFIQEIPPNLIEEVRPRIRVGHLAGAASSGVGVGRSLGRAPLQEAIGGGMSLGTRVRHGKFGEGVVLTVEGQGPHARVQVNFEQQGSKWLMLQYANLEVV